jgi:hypothetical protein
MSEVFSFRLSDQNPREAQAREVIKAWVAQGYTLRHILTEALLLLGSQRTNSAQIKNLAEIVERLSKLVDWLDGNSEVVSEGQPTKADLSTSFISSIKMTIKPGMRIYD